jgi:hypothetical protein
MLANRQRDEAVPEVTFGSPWPRPMGHMHVIYIGSPYTIRRCRAPAALRGCTQRMLQGAVVYSPIAHSHPSTERCSLPVDWEFWAHFDR